MPKPYEEKGAHKVQKCGNDASKAENKVKRGPTKHELKGIKLEFFLLFEILVPRAYENLNPALPSRAKVSEPRQVKLFKEGYVR